MHKCLHVEMDLPTSKMRHKAITEVFPGGIRWMSTNKLSTCEEILHMISMVGVRMISLR